MFICENCGNEFKGKSGKVNRFCSKVCYDKWRKGKPAPNMDGLKLGRGWNKGRPADWAKGENNVNWAGGKVTLICHECGKSYETWPYLKDKSKYCSTECADKHTLILGRGWNKKFRTIKLKRKEASNDLVKLKSSNAPKTVTLQCKHCEKQYDVPLYRSEKSNYCSRECAGKDRFSGENHPGYGKKRDDIAGTKNPNWNGGNSRDYKSHYNSLEYRNWRREVFKRDSFICQVCGKRGGYLEAHHKVGWAEDKSKRYDVDNGVTLCRQCHVDTDHHRAKFVKDKQS